MSGRRSGGPGWLVPILTISARLEASVAAQKLQDNLQLLVVTHRRDRPTASQPHERRQMRP
jgi:hypothetical protein